MLPFIGKATFFVLVAIGVISTVAIILHGPPSKGVQTYQAVIRQKPHCNYLQFAEKADTTFWEVACTRPSVPWDTVRIELPEP